MFAKYLSLYNSLKTKAKKYSLGVLKGSLKCLQDCVYLSGEKCASGRMSSNSSCAVKRRASSASNMIAFWIPFSNSSPNVMWCVRKK